MANITFVTGGARSGKSSFATRLAIESGGETAYIATYNLNEDDKEMVDRVDNHKKDRPCEWDTLEESSDLAPLLRKINGRFNTVMIDCVTVFLSNLLLANYGDELIKERVNNVIATLKEVDYNVYIVSNEVGCGLVPESSLGRKFRDLAGKANQLLAANADSVYFVVSGIPMKIK